MNKYIFFVLGVAVSAYGMEKKQSYYKIDLGGIQVKNIEFSGQQNHLLMVTTMQDKQEICFYGRNDWLQLGMDDCNFFELDRNKRPVIETISEPVKSYDKKYSMFPLNKTVKIRNNKTGKFKSIAHKQEVKTLAVDDKQEFIAVAEKNDISTRNSRVTIWSLENVEIEGKDLVAVKEIENNLGPVIAMKIFDKNLYAISKRRLFNYPLKGNNHFEYEFAEGIVLKDLAVSADPKLLAIATNKDLRVIALDQLSKIDFSGN